jgi:predicted enzyme related to lactoylglutathione lyase
MTLKTSYSPGEFCWIELATSDWKKAKQFYTSLFGWTTNEMPMGPDQPPYVIVQKNGKDVGALYENKKAPSAWLSYVSVKSADESAKKAKSLGGKVMAEPFDVMDLGRMANLQDPQGARFAIWQPKKRIGADVVNEPNTMCWNELTTTDVEGARKFYSALFTWKLKISPEYTEIHVGDTGVGGIFPMPKEMTGVPPYWMPYFAVGDCDAAAKKAKSLGAKAWVEPKDIPKVGRFSILADPFGAPIAVIKLERG